MKSIGHPSNYEVKCLFYYNLSVTLLKSETLSVQLTDCMKNLLVALFAALRSCKRGWAYLIIVASSFSQLPHLSLQNKTRKLLLI